MEKTEIKNFLILGLALILLLLPSVHAQDYLQEGRLTKRSPAIKELSDELYTISLATTYPTNFNKSLINSYEKRYIMEVVLWINKNIDSGNKKLDWWMYDADWVLKNKEGTCSEVSVLTCSLLREKEIPCRLKAFKLTPRMDHIYVQAYLDGKWYVIDPLWSISLEEDPLYYADNYPFRYLEPERDVTKFWFGDGV